MERQQWAALCLVLKSVSRGVGRLPRARFGDYLILRLYFWAVLHDRPMTWTQDRFHYTRYFRPRKLPSVSQLNRRVASDRFQVLLQRVHERLGGLRSGRVPSALYVDGKPLDVSFVSGDRDARRGKLTRGYKLHAVVADDRTVPVFCVTPLNRHEVPVAHAMLEALPASTLAGTPVLADANYDAHELHKRVHAAGGWLVTRPRLGGPGQRKPGGHPVNRRRMGVARRTLVDLWDKCPALMARFYRRRGEVERVFGHLTCTPGLLGGLPPFVRGLPRVRRWVGAKICLYHARRLARLATL